MSELLRGVVVSHGDVAAALVEAVARITGHTDGLVAVSNHGCDRATLEQRVAEAVGNAPAVLFVDLPSGSCLLAAARYLRAHGDVACVAGVNLAMLVDFMYHREATPAEAADRALATGGRAIKVIGL
jgi:mannose/fructose-specific phosphotransferase system component IIA